MPELHKVNRLGLGKNEKVLLNNDNGDISFSITWYSDKERKNKANNAVLGDTMYYRIICNGIPENTHLKLRMYDTNQPFGNTNLNKFQFVTIRNRKIESSVFFGIEYYNFIEKDTGDEIEIYWKVDFGGKTYDIFNSILHLQDDEYYRAVLSGSKYVYTCNCGWIDKTHFKTTTNRPRKDIGATNLWEQIEKESGISSVWSNGFQVVYSQDAKVGPTTPTVTKKYFVKKGLPKETRERIAMTIMQEVSMEFERFQSLGVVIGKGDSSFEPADLVSNILGLYSVLRPKLTEKNILENICKQIGVDKSIKVYKKYPGTFSLSKYKNKKFTPRFFDSEFCKNSVFPKEFQEITPLPKDNDNFRDWIDLFDIHNGIPPITAP